MPTIRLPEESEHGDMVKKIDSMIRELSKAPHMTPTSRALGLRPSILMGNHQELGSVPRYFSYMAGDPGYAKIILDREIATIHEGEVSRLNKELVAFATSLMNDGKLSITYRAEMLRSLGMTNEQIFEATTVISVYA